MTKTLKTLSVMAVLIAAFAASAFAGNSDKYYYSQMVAKATGQGLVYVGTSNATPADSEYKTEATQSLNTTNDQNHSYYLFAKDGEEAFVGWYTDEACTDLKSNDNPYTYNVTATSTSSSNPSTFNLYAKFVRQDFTTYSRLTVESTGGGQVFVSATSSGTQAFATDCTAAQSVVNGNAHTYYIYAKPDNDLTFVGWFADYECTQPLENVDGNVYTFECDARSESAAEAKTIYAKFGENPYQIPNPGFEQWNDSQNEPNPGWHSFPTGTGSLIGIAGSGLQATRVEGRTGYAAQVNSVSKMGVGANGNLTTGRINAGSMTATDATGNYNFSDLDNEGFYLVVNGQPDAIEFYAKFSAASNNQNGCGHMQAYMHKACSRFQDPRMDSQNEYVLAAAGTNIMPSAEWQRCEAAFSYEDYSVAELAAETKYMLISFSTNPTPGQSYGDVLTVDDVRLIYNSELVSLKYNGKAMDIEGGKIYVGDEFDMSLLELKSGRAADIHYELNDEGQLVVEIKGQDFDYNPANTHSYTFEIVDGEAPDPENPYPFEIAAIDELSNATAYTLHVNRGYLPSEAKYSSVNGDDGYILGVNEAEAGRYAIINYNGAYYLYSVDLDKFLSAQGTAPGGQWFLDQPNGDFQLTANTENEGTFIIALAADGNYLQLGGSKEMVNNTGWKTLDDGNQWTITAVGAFNFSDDLIRRIDPSYSPAIAELTLTAELSYADEAQTDIYATVTVEGLTGKGVAYWFTGEGISEDSEGTAFEGNSFVVRPSVAGVASSVKLTVREYDYDQTPVALYSDGSIVIKFPIPTAISGVAATGNAAVYNLNGQRVSSLRKGLYIVNGKKLVK